MDVRQRKLSMRILVWCLVVPILLGSSRGIDPILTHMCSMENGVRFWRAFLDCSVLLDEQPRRKRSTRKRERYKVETVLNTCIPLSSPEEVERTRCTVCLKPDRWVKMMDCMNAHLIELQDESNPNLELSPDLMYRSCVSVLVSEADRSVYNKEPFLPEDDRNFTSDCSTIDL